MFLRLLQRLETTITGGAVLIAVASFISRILGLLRDRMLFSTFGAGDTLDSYFAAFRIPDFLFNILVLGALSSAFIPVFLKHDREEGWRIANGVLTMLLIIFGVFAVVAFIFAPKLAPLFAPGFSGEKLATTILLSRIMLLSMLLFVASNVLSCMLNALRRFLAFALSPIAYNIGIIIGIVVLYPTMGVAGLAWGVVLGAFLHLALQLPSVRRMGWRYRWPRPVLTGGARRIFQLMGPRTVGLAAVQIEQVVSTMFASTLAVGSVSMFNAAQNIQSFPINIFGISLAVSSFPVFSTAWNEGRTADFINEFSRIFRRILFFVAPVTVLFLLLRAHVVRLVLGAGNFDWDATFLTAQTLGLLALSLFAQSLIPMLARSFYAIQDTRTPMFVSVSAVVLNLSGALLLVGKLGILGLAISLTVASFVHMLALLFLLRKRLGDLDDATILSSTIKIMIASAVMTLVVWLTLQVAARGVDQQTFVGIFLQGSTAALAGSLAYVSSAYLFRFSEVAMIERWVVGGARRFFSILKKIPRA